MEVKSLITSVDRYFSSLSVGSPTGDSRVLLIKADDNKQPIALNGDGQGEYSSVLELDATESITTNISNTTMKHQAESHQTYVDGIIRNSNTMTIIAHIDETKLSILRKFSDPNVWMYILHTKDMGGTVNSIEYDPDATLYHLSSINIVDEGYKNTVKVQLDLEEVRLYKHSVEYKFGVQQTNTVSGDDTSTITNETRNESWLDVGNRHLFGGDRKDIEGLKYTIDD